MQEKKAINMNVGGIVTKLTAKADTLAMIYAIMADPIADGRGISGAPGFMIHRITHWKIPDPYKILEMVMSYSQYSDNIKNAIMLYIAGEGLNAIGQSKYGNISKKVAEGLAKGTAVAALLWLPAINPHGAQSSGATLKNFASAPSVGYGY